MARGNKDQFPDWAARNAERQRQAREAREAAYTTNYVKLKAELGGRTEIGLRVLKNYANIEGIHPDDLKEIMEQLGYTLDEGPGIKYMLTHPPAEYTLPPSRIAPPAEKKPTIIKLEGTERPLPQERPRKPNDGNSLKDEH